MIEQLIAQSGVPCRGGFIAYYHDMSVYCPDPIRMCSRAIGVVICGDGRLLICPADLTRPDDVPENPGFRRISRDLFGRRSTGALFATGCYFSIDSGELAGSYQISDDRIVCEEFPTARAYRRYLLQGESGGSSMA